MANTSVDKYVKYKVKDMSLAEWGRKEIKLAEAEMPGLMAQSEHRIVLAFLDPVIAQRIYIELPCFCL